MSILKKLFKRNKKQESQSRYKQVEFWVDSPDYRWIDGENVYTSGYWSSSSIPIDSESNKFERMVVNHIENNYSVENFIDHGGSLEDWVRDNGFRIKDCKPSTVRFYRNQIEDWENEII